MFLSIVSYLLAIAEHLPNLGLLRGLYSVVSETTVSYFLILFGTAFLVVYIVAIIRERTAKRGPTVFLLRKKPLPHQISPHGTDYGVRWTLHIYGSMLTKNQVWADGPYCPKCYRELEETKKGTVIKKLFWICPNCRREFPRPDGDVKDMVEKDFAADFRRKGKL